MKVPGANRLGIRIDEFDHSDHLANAQVRRCVTFRTSTARRLLSQRSSPTASLRHLKTGPSYKRIRSSALRPMHLRDFLGMREAWICRDWRKCRRGSDLIRPAESDDRKYEIIGYGEFEQLDSSSTGKERLAIDRLFQVFDDLDLSIEDRFDARPTQLRAVAKASAELILAIDRIQGQRSILSAYSRARAEEVLVKGKEQSSADRISGGQKFVETPLPRHRYW